MLTNNVKTHILLFRDGTKLNITREQYTTLRLQKEDKRRGDMITIKDADTKEIVFDGEYGDIKGFQERKQDPNLYGAVYICDFGTRHPMSEGGTCDCSKEYNYLGITFQDKLRAMGYKINYPKDITREMKIAFKQSVTGKQ